jgi:hypothetical protein
MKTCGGVSVEFKAFLTSAQDGCRSSSPRRRHFIERKEAPVEAYVVHSYDISGD